MNENESVFWKRQGKRNLWNKMYSLSTGGGGPRGGKFKRVREGEVGSQGWICRDQNISAKSFGLISDFLLSPR